MRYMFRFLSISALFGAFLLTAHAAEVKVFAAASLTDALQAIAIAYKAQSNDAIIFNFAGSNVLARQIIQGAPVDIFLSADEAEMNVVADAGLLAVNGRRNLLSNTLVIILPKDSGLSVRGPSDLAKGAFKRIALGDPETVPAGVYAKKYLESRGIWASVQGKLIPTENVRAALAAVTSGNADAGIVYKTDALISSKVKIAYEVPATDGPEISYPIALMKAAEASTEARKWLEYLESPQAIAIFSQYGFLTAK